MNRAGNPDPSPGSSGLVPAVGGEHAVPAADRIARDYILLALRLDQHAPGLVDAYVGPRDLKAQVDTESLRPPVRLAGDAAELRDRLSAEVTEPDRGRWIDRQLIALETQALLLTGLDLPYVELVSRCFDACPEPLAAATYASVREDLDRLLPGTGDLRRRLDAWDARFTIPTDRVQAVVDWLVPRLREASDARFPAPAGESVVVNLVTDQPWSGYNWYDGGLRSRIDINVDLPLRPHDLVATLSHETFPGHHLEHAWKEQRLVREQRRLEAALLLINTPECYVSEGLAELGRRFTIDADAWRRLLGGAYGLAGTEADEDDAARQVAIGDALHRIRGAGGDAALRLHADREARDEVHRFLVEEALMDPDRAERRLRFIEHPLWRTYVFSYAGGERLLASWCDAAGSPEGARSRFFRLLTEQLTPSGIREDLAKGPSGAP